MRNLIIKLISLYQKTLSPDHGWLKFKYPYGYCKFYPSCSEYTKQAIAQRGVAAGVGLGALRILKCNPWSENKIDELPQLN
jgi:hypothetical protein